MVFKCIKQYAAEPEIYGIDFKVGKKYIGKIDTDGYYIESTENGTSVLLTKSELEEYFVLA